MSKSREARWLPAVTGRILSVSQSLSEKVCLAQIGITHYFSLDLELELAAGKSSINAKH